MKKGKHIMQVKKITFKKGSEAETEAEEEDITSEVIEQPKRKNKKKKNLSSDMLEKVSYDDAVFELPRILTFEELSEKIQQLKINNSEPLPAFLRNLKEDKQYEIGWIEDNVSFEKKSKFKKENFKSNSDFFSAILFNNIFSPEVETTETFAKQYFVGEI